MVAVAVEASRTSELIEKVTLARRRSMTLTWPTWPMRTPAIRTSSPLFNEVTSVKTALKWCPPPPPLVMLTARIAVANTVTAMKIALLISAGQSPLTGSSRLSRIRAPPLAVARVDTQIRTTPSARAASRRRGSSRKRSSHAHFGAAQGRAEEQAAPLGELARRDAHGRGDELGDELVLLGRVGGAEILLGQQRVRGRLMGRRRRRQRRVGDAGRRYVGAPRPVAVAVRLGAVRAGLVRAGRGDGVQRDVHAGFLRPGP